ncbi:MAG: hypothetical protein ACXVKQ_20950 [Acidimicrobiia bacterium]
MDELVTADDPNSATEPTDPVAERRARIGRVVGFAKRVGYLGLLVAIVGFVISAVAGFPSWSVALTIAGLVVGIVVLPLPIILGYGIRAAEREERGGGRFH